MANNVRKKKSLRQKISKLKNEKKSKKPTLKGLKKKQIKPINNKNKEKEFIDKKERKNVKIRITESKIKKLLDFEHLEELFFLLHILNKSQIMNFIEHYKKSKISRKKDNKIDSIINKSKTPEELIENIKKEFISSLEEEYKELKGKIISGRKKGVDVFIEDLKLMAVPSKINLFSATSNKQDFYKVKKTLKEVKESLEDKIIKS